jgi:hypothetical protein
MAVVLLDDRNGRDADVAKRAGSGKALLEQTMRVSGPSLSQAGRLFPTPSRQSAVNLL